MLGIMGKILVLHTEITVHIFQQTTLKEMVETRNYSKQLVFLQLNSFNSWVGSHMHKEKENVQYKFQKKVQTKYNQLLPHSLVPTYSTETLLVVPVIFCWHHVVFH